MQTETGSIVPEKASIPREVVISNPRRAPKSRDGCQRCKAKRLKCDERKPECSQCCRKNIACPGYKSKSLVWSTKHEKTLLANANISLPPSSEKLARSLTESLIREGHEQRDESKESVQQEQQESPPASPPANMPEALQQNDTKRDSIPGTDSLAAIRQQLQRSAMPEFLVHLPTMLVEYYFTYVCQIFSSFDGTMNPFRTTVGRLWDASAPIYYAIQSMAAAYLANHFPRMSPVAIQMQLETYKCLYQAPQAGRDPAENLDKTLLTVLLVGQTTAWHNPKDLGLVHLRTAKRLNRRRLEQQGPSVDSRVRRQNEFFGQCIMYWDMLAGFVEDDIDEFGFKGFSMSETGISRSPESEASPSVDGTEKVFPHPWTGVAPRVFELFAQVGRLIRSYRKSIAQNTTSLNLLSLELEFNMDFPQESLTTIEATMKAQSLEEELLSFSPPSASNLVDAGDLNTPVQQYLVLAEAFRCAALLEIYRVFPSILYKRIPLANEFTPSTAEMDQLSRILPIPTTQAPDSFLVSLAMHTLSLLELLPSTSGTRCLQPIVFICAASELRFGSSSTPFDPSSHFDPLSASNFFFAPTSTSTMFNSLTSREVDIAAARRFATTRLQEYQSSLPAKPVIKALQLIQETWERADLGQDVYWMEVMDEMGWNTIFG